MAWVLVKAKTLFDYASDDEDDYGKTDDEGNLSEEDLTRQRPPAEWFGEGGQLTDAISPSRPKVKVSRGRRVKVKDSADTPTPKASPNAEATDGHTLAVIGDLNHGKMLDSELMPLNPENRLEEHYANMGVIDDKMDEWIALHGMPNHIITDGSPSGNMVEQWANDNDVKTTSIPANFSGNKFTAIPTRNQAIFDMNPTHLLTFHRPMGDSGTVDALVRGNEKGIPMHQHNFLRPNEPLQEVGNKGSRFDDNWYNKFIDEDTDVRGKKIRVIRPKQRRKLDEMSAEDRLHDAMKRVYGKEFASGRMNLQSAKQREAGVKDTSRVEGFPMRAPLSSYTTRHLPKDERTAEEKESDRLNQMAMDMVAGNMGNITVDLGGGSGKETRLPEDILADRRSAREQREANQRKINQLAMGNLPVDPKGNILTPKQKADEQRMMDDLAELQKPKKRPTPKPVRKPKVRAKRAKDAPPKSLFDLIDDDQKNAGEPIDVAWDVLLKYLEEDEKGYTEADRIQEALERTGRGKITDLRPQRSMRQEEARNKIAQQRQRLGMTPEQRKVGVRQKTGLNERRGSPGAKPMTRKDMESVARKKAKEQRERELEEYRRDEARMDKVRRHPGNTSEMDDNELDRLGRRMKIESFRQPYANDATWFRFLRNNYPELLTEATKGVESLRDEYENNKELRDMMDDIPEPIRETLLDDPDFKEYLESEGVLPQSRGIQINVPHTLMNEGEIHSYRPAHEIGLSVNPDQHKALEQARAEISQRPEAEINYDMRGRPKERLPVQPFGYNVDDDTEFNLAGFEGVPTFEGIKFNPDTGFTRGNPLDIAWDSLLKKR